MLSIVIPSRNEMFLDNTIRDVLKNATGEIEVFPVVDGYEPDEIIKDDRVHYIRLPKNKEMQKRHGINFAIAQASGDFVMSLDAHCMVAPGFDEVLAKDITEENQVIIPRRNRLDAENWCIQTQCDDRPPIDFEYTMWPLKFDKPGLHGFRWDARTYEYWDSPINETMHFQGSCWFMHKTWFYEMGLMQIEGYTGWGQEAEEIGLKTWRAGGKVLTDKNTWYAHLHKGNKYGRGYFQTRHSIDICNKYSFQYWVYENKDFYEKFIERFWPVPGWPSDWKQKLWM